MKKIQSVFQSEIDFCRVLVGITSCRENHFFVPLTLFQLVLLFMLFQIKHCHIVTCLYFNNF